MSLLLKEGFFLGYKNCTFEELILRKSS